MTENKKVLQVLKGFTNLSESEKQILIRELNNYQDLGSFGQTQTSREIAVKLQSHLGPTSDRSCACCGKS